MHRSILRNTFAGLFIVLLVLGVLDATRSAVAGHPLARDDPGMADYWRFRDPDEYAARMAEANQGTEITGLLDYASYLRDSGYPQTAQANWLRDRHAQPFSPATLRQAHQRLARINDDCRAAVDLKLFLDSRQDEMTDVRKAALVGELLATWLLPSVWTGGDWVLKKLAFESPQLAFANNILSSYETITRAIAGTMAGDIGRWSLNVYEQALAEGWSPSRIEQERRQRVAANQEQLSQLEAVRQRYEGLMLAETARHEQALQSIPETYEQRLQRISVNESSQAEMQRRIEWLRQHPGQPREGQGFLALPDGVLDERRNAFVMEAWPEDLCAGTPHPDCGKYYREQRADAELNRQFELAAEHARYELEMTRLANLYEREVQRHLVRITQLQVEQAALGKYVLPLVEDDCERLRRPAMVAEILHSEGARIVRADPLADLADGTAGRVVLSGGGSWKQAYGGWRTEENPPNRPLEVSGGTVGPGVYRAVLHYSPSVPNAMTAGNFNTGMAIFLQHPSYRSRQGAVVGSLKPQWNHEPDGEATTTFTIDRPGTLSAVFSMAASRGQAGGYAEHAQSFSGRVEFVKALEEQAALPDTRLRSGDTLRNGNRFSSLRLVGGGSLRVAPHSTVRIEEGPDRGLLIRVESGDVRIVRTGSAPRRALEVRDEARDLRVVPQGTDFRVGAHAVEVFSGVVELGHGEQTLQVPAGMRYVLRTGSLEAIADSPEMLRSADGIPLSWRYWDAVAQPHGDQAPVLDPGDAGTGWLLADPLTRWYPSGTRATVNAEASGRLDLLVPAHSRLEARQDTAPRLLHPITGDFDLSGRLVLQRSGNAPASVRFVARVPGHYAGGNRSGLLDDTGSGPGRDYVFTGTALHLPAAEGVQVPLLNQATASSWPVHTAERPIHVRLVRRGDFWVSAWSLDGHTWQTGQIDYLHALPDTLWAGFAFINTAGSDAQPVTAKIDQLVLRTAPRGTLALPDWFGQAQGGEFRTAADGAEVSLHLNPDSGAWVRAFSGEVLKGDFDLDFGFQIRGQIAAGDAVRWSLAAVTPEEAGVAVVAEWGGESLRYGILPNPRGGYPGSGRLLLDDGSFREEVGRFRLVREGTQMRGYIWRDGLWQLYRELKAPDTTHENYAGPLFLRLEAARTGGGASADVVLDFRPGDRFSGPATRLRRSAEMHQGAGDFARALALYQQSLALQPDPDLADRVQRLQTYTQVGTGAAARSPVEVQPGASPDDAIVVRLGQSLLATLAPQDQHWFQTTLAQPGSLSLTLQGYGTLSYHLELSAGPRVLERASGPAPQPGQLETDPVTVTRSDLLAGEYLVRVRHGGSSGPYILQVHQEANPFAPDVEPNDEPGQAQALPVNLRHTGLIGFRGDGEIDRRDWFAVVLEEPGSLIVEWTGEDSLVANLYLHDAEGRRELARDYRADGHERRLRRDDLLPGNYLLRLDHYRGHGGYVLEPRTQPNAHANDLEPNDEPEQAQPLALNATQTGLLGFHKSDGDIDRRDWFAVALEEPGSITVEWTGEDSLVANLYLHDGEGRRELARDYRTDDHERRIHRGDLPAGSYLLRIDRYQGHGGYRFRTTGAP